MAVAVAEVGSDGSQDKCEENEMFVLCHGFGFTC